MASFKKTISQPTSRFFKKSTGEINRFFKKGGQFQQGVSDVGSALGTAGNYISKGAKIGNQVLGAVSKSPFGAVLAPEIAVASSGLNALSLAGNAAKAGQSVSKDLISGRSVGSITTNTLEKARALQKEGNAIKFA